MLDLLDTASMQQTPKLAVHDVSSQLGGVIHAATAGSLPRNQQQAKDKRRKLKTDSSKDPLLSAMFMCKESMSGFVRRVMGAPDYMIVIADDRTLDNLVRFCTNTEAPQILSVDPTFSLGQFDVTVTTYKHPMLTASTSDHPSMLGPILIHQRKQFQNYQFFSTSLLGLRPSLQQLCAFGTDGEVALVDAFHSAFPNAIHLRCFLHFKDNLKHKLEHKMKIPRHVSNEFLFNVLGCVSSREKGLVNAEDEEIFTTQLESLREPWNEREEAATKMEPIFHDWFIRNCSNTIRSTMLPTIRKSAGLGTPPAPYYMNALESMNSLLKRYTNNKKLDLCTFITKLKDVIDVQFQEVDRAVAGLGEYSVSDRFPQFIFSAAEWAQLNTEQRKKVLSKFVEFAPTANEDSGIVSQTEDQPCHQGEGDNPLSVLQIPPYIANIIWEQQRALQNPNSIVDAPGVSQADAWMVADCKGLRPHYVELRKGQYSCDKKWTYYQCVKVCPHILAVVVKDGKLDNYLARHSKANTKLNMTTLAQSGLPISSVGKKVSKRKGVTKKTSNKVRKIIAEETSWTVRKSLENIVSTQTSSQQTPSAQTVVSQLAQPQPSSQLAQPQPPSQLAQPQPPSQLAQPQPPSQLAQPQPLSQLAQPQPPSQLAQPQSSPQLAQPQPVSSQIPLSLPPGPSRLSASYVPLPSPTPPTLLSPPYLFRPHSYGHLPIFLL